MNGKEIWRDIPGYENLYEVSSIDRVRSLDKISPITGEVILGKLLPQIETSSGNMMVRLSKRGIRKAFLIENLKSGAFSSPEDDDRLKEAIFCEETETLFYRFPMTIDDLKDIIENVETGMSKEEYRKAYKKPTSLYRIISNKPEFLKWAISNYKQYIL